MSGASPARSSALLLWRRMSGVVVSPRVGSVSVVAAAAGSGSGAALSGLRNHAMMPTPEPPSFNNIGGFTPR
jgi:hypothetical protein